jgi:hypothetical protein
MYRSLHYLVLAPPHAGNAGARIQPDHALAHQLHPQLPLLQKLLVRPVISRSPPPRAASIRSLRKNRLNGRVFLPT